MTTFGNYQAMEFKISFHTNEPDNFTNMTKQQMEDFDSRLLSLLSRYGYVLTASVVREKIDGDTMTKVKRKK